MTDGLAALSVLAWLAYLASRLLARRKVPELVGFLLVGAALGPSGFELLTADDLARLAPVTEVALAILMFLIGERVSARALRASRWALSAGLVQYVLSGFAVYGASIALGADDATALLLAALAGAGAPLTIASIVASAKAQGAYPSGLVSSHAVCDALAATTFAAVLPVAILLADDSATVGNAIGNFVQLGIGGAVLGLAFGWLISRFGYQIETSGELLLFVLVHLLVGWSIAEQFDISLPLAALIGGAVAATRAPEEFSVRLFRTIRTIEQPLYLLFFALAGASIHLEDVPQVGLVGIGYLIVRTITKIVGSLIGGGVLGGLGWHDGLRLGIDSVPQAGVAVGLAVLAGEQLEGPGTEAATIVLGSVVVFELIGPLLVARGLAGGPRQMDERVAPPDPLLTTPEVVLIGSQHPLRVPDWVLEQCERWDASLVAMLTSDDETTEPDLRVRAARVDVPLDVRRWVPGESFTGALVRLREEVRAGLVVLAARPPSTVGSGSRLVLMPHERIARQVPVPVMLLPLPVEAELSDELPVRHRRHVGRRMFRKIWRRSPNPVLDAQVEPPPPPPEPPRDAAPATEPSPEPDPPQPEPSTRSDAADAARPPAGSPPGPQS
ncbi:MAG: cation:proton antiporter [Actinomycetota bacterium]